MVFSVGRNTVVKWVYPNLTHHHDRRTLTEKGEWDLNVPVSRDKLKVGDQSKVKYEAHSAPTVTY